jgi:cyclopropane fatty-acyl-phospholipid synthase-like methyltransferase
MAHILTFAERYKAQTILDMGSGDGRLLILLSNHGYTTHGVEINPLLVLRSRKAIRAAGLSNLASVSWGSFWRADVAPYDVVVLYVIKHIMPRLESKLSVELHQGAMVVSNFFVFPNLTPVDSIDRICSYRVE